MNTSDTGDDYEGDADLLRLAQQRFHSWLAGLAGDAYDQLVSDRDFAARCLHSPDDGLRSAALVVLCRQWLKPDEATDICLHFTYESCDLIVTCATETLGYILANTRHQVAGRRLATLATDSMSTWTIRVSAYRALAFIHSEALLLTHNLLQIQSDRDFDKNLISIYM